MSRVIAGLALVLGVVPLCSYVRVQRLQGVASASSVPGTAWTAGLATASSMLWHCRPAVLLPCWALVAKPEDLLAAFQSGIVGKVSLWWIAFMVPSCQDKFAVRVLTLCKGLTLAGLLARFTVTAFWAASFILAHPCIR